MSQVKLRHTLKEPIATFNSLREAARSLNNVKIHDYHVTASAQGNSILEGYRWFVIDNHTDNALPAEIPKTAKETPKTKMRNKGLVAQLDTTQTNIINVYPNIQSASDAFKVAACGFTTAINTQKKCADFYWKMYDECSTELQSTFKDPLPIPVFSRTSSKSVQRIEPTTNEVLETYTSIQDVTNLYKISHKHMHKLNTTGNIYHGFKWKVVEKN